MPIRWYSWSATLETVDHETLDCRQALEIADRYLGAPRQHYDYGEEAVAASTFGFVRDDESFMEVSVHARDDIHVEYDFAPIVATFWRRLLAREQQHSERLRSRDALRSRIELFFAHSSESMRQRLVDEGGDAQG